MVEQEECILTIENNTPNYLAGINNIKNIDYKHIPSNRKDIDFTKNRDKYSLMRLKQKKIIKKIL